MLEEMFTNHVNNNNNRSIIPSMNPYDPVTNRLISNPDNRKQENTSMYQINRRTSQTSSRNRSISSSMNDNESSNSTTPSSPLSIHQHRNRLKDELQHVPSINGTTGYEEPRDVVKKEKKRERNRQAAQKCRTRKLTRIAELQKRVNELQGKNKDLSSIAECLQSDISRLEKQLHDHHTQGCTLMNGSVL
jgi:chromosome segregation ATPase